MRCYVAADLEIEITSDIDVTQVLQAGDDHLVVGSARVSTGHEADLTKLKGTIRKLAQEGHYSPLEHGLLTVDIHCPNFIAKEILRHRHFGFSEFSQRYVKDGEAVPPIFWGPSPLRALMRDVPFKPMNPVMHQPTMEQYGEVVMALKRAYEEAYFQYRKLLDLGVVPEVARGALPNAVYTTLRVSGNLRAWLHFLALRTHEEGAHFTSYPQAEIEEVARQVEALIKKYWPLTFKFWDECGRIPC